MKKIIDKLLGVECTDLEINKGLNTAREIIQQPETWKEEVEYLSKNKEEIKSFIANILSIKDCRIILTGAGTSAFVGESSETYLTKFLGRKVEAIATTDLVSSPKSHLIKNIPTLLISFARSGNSPESIHAINLAKEIVDDLYQIIITCNKSGELAINAREEDKSLLLLMPDKTNDLGFAMTSSFTTMLISLIGIFNIDNIENYKEDIAKLSNSVVNFIENNTEKVAQLANEEFERIIYLGSGTSKGISRESALKILELTAGKVNANYDTPLGFRHGPKSVIDDTTITVVYVSNDDYTRKYDLDLVNEILEHRKNDKVIVVGSNINEDIKKKANYIFELELVDYSVSNEALLPLQQIILAQMVSFLKSINLGITPDNPCPTGEVNRVVKGVTLYNLG